MLYIKYSTLCNAGHRSSWRGRGNGKGWMAEEGKQDGFELLVYIYVGGVEDNVIADLKEVDVCQIIISVWRCNIKGQLGNTITI